MLAEHVLKHSIGVAEFMFNYVKDHPELEYDPYEFYVIGLLHDIGKLYPGDYDPKGKNEYKNHSFKGGELLCRLGFKFHNEVSYHGHPEFGYLTRPWLILNLADLSVNGKGQIVNVEERVKNIGKRYGEDSEEYNHVKEIYNILHREGMV